jgi:hypothetical protein
MIRLKIYVIVGWRLNIKYIINEIGRGVISPNLNVALKN